MAYEKINILSDAFYETFDEIKRICERMYRATEAVEQQKLAQALEIWLVTNWRTFDFDVDFLTDLGIDFIRKTAETHKDGRAMTDALKVKADHACYDRLQELWQRFLKYHADIKMMREGHYILYDNGIPAVYTVQVFPEIKQAMQHAVKDLKLKSGYYTIQCYPEQIVRDPEIEDSSAMMARLGMEGNK
jgi:hypothetical protein